MNDLVEIWKTISTAGLAPALGIGLYFVWHTWRAERLEYRATIDQLAGKLELASTQRHTEVLALLDRYHSLQDKVLQECHGLVQAMKGPRGLTPP